MGNEKKPVGRPPFKNPKNYKRSVSFTKNENELINELYPERGEFSRLLSEIAVKKLLTKKRPETMEFELRKTDNIILQPSEINKINDKANNYVFNYLDSLKLQYKANEQGFDSFKDFIENRLSVLYAPDGYSFFNI